MEEAMTPPQGEPHSWDVLAVVGGRLTIESINRGKSFFNGGFLVRNGRGGKVEVGPHLWEAREESQGLSRHFIVMRT